MAEIKQLYFKCHHLTQMSKLSIAHFSAFLLYKNNLERAVVKQLTDHLYRNSLFDGLQSGFRIHITKTGLVKITSDLMAPESRVISVVELHSN